MFKKIKQYLKEDKYYILFLIVIFILCNYKLPYYINMPGGTIKINDRIKCDNCNDINGSLNMLYVTEYVASIPTYLLSYVIPNWDLESISVQQINNESVEEINVRNKLMLENSIDNALYVAYKEAGKDINIREKKTFIATTLDDNNLKIGDELLEVDNNVINDYLEVKNIILSHDVGDSVLFKVRRNNKEINISSKVREESGNKVIGVVIITDYVFDMDPILDIKFKEGESGASGGLMMALSMYTKISDDDIVRGRKIAGTGTISFDGSVGRIDGIKYKIIGAVRNNMDVVLVPSGNYEEAIKIKEKNKYDIDIVSVDNFSDAINYLKNS
ncbi:MAG: PDZ domain-containing protein [Bacilli bacterium]|nr:PDZ domain-containing protein [Bacilli bacterium]